MANFEELVEINEEKELVEEPEEETMYPEESGGGVLGKIVLCVLAVGAGVGTLVYKIKKADEYRIKKLEKKGYVVLKPEAASTDEIVDVDADELDEFFEENE